MFCPFIDSIIFVDKVSRLDAANGLIVVEQPVRDDTGDCDSVGNGEVDVLVDSNVGILFEVTVTRSAHDIVVDS
jgi:hypothetical protein